MLPNALITAADLCQLSIPFVSLTAYLPQWLRLFRTRSSADHSLGAWCLWGVSAAFALFYALVQQARFGQSWALVCSTAISLLFILLTIAMILKFRGLKPTQATAA